MSLSRQVAEHNRESKEREAARMRHERLHADVPKPASCVLCRDAAKLAEVDRLVAQGRLVTG